MKISVEVYDKTGKIALDVLAKEPGVVRKFIVYFPADDQMIIGIGPKFLEEEEGYLHHRLATWMGIEEDTICRSMKRKTETGRRIEGGGFMTFTETESKYHKGGKFRSVTFYGSSGDYSSPSSLLCSNDTVRKIIAEMGANSVSIEFKMQVFDAGDGGLRF